MELNGPLPQHFRDATCGKALCASPRNCTQMQCRQQASRAQRSPAATYIASQPAASRAPAARPSPLTLFSRPPPPLRTAVQSHGGLPFSFFCTVQRTVLPAGVRSGPGKRQQRARSVPPHLFFLAGLLTTGLSCLMTTGLSLAKAKLAKKAHCQWVPLRAGPARLSKRTKNLNLFWALISSHFRAKFSSCILG
jgi:hypothetical protein